MDDNWISVEERLPEYLEGKDYSANVFATDGNYLYVMARCYDNVAEAWLWGNCQGNIDGEPECDDDYQITHWQPLPPPPRSK